EPAARRLCRRGRARADPELRPDVRDVPVDGVLADDEARGDLRVAQALADEAEHLQLPRRQRTAAAAAVGDAEAGELPARTGAFGRCRLVPAERGESVCELE